MPKLNRGIQTMQKRHLMMGLAALPLMSAKWAWADGEKTPETASMHDLVKIKDGFHQVKGEGGNVLLSTGSDGSLLIDCGFERNGAALKAFLSSNGYEPQYLINTHWHGDHTGGNQFLSDKAVIVAHENVKKRLSADQEVKLFNMKMPAQPEAAMPVEVFSQEKQLQLNGQNFDLVYYADSHTDSDSVTYIPTANMVHTGDLYFSGMFPFIDPDSKGNIANIINSLSDVIKNIDSDTIIMPGHGAISNQKDLQATVDMLKQSAEVVQGYADQELSLAEMQEKGLPKELVETWGQGFINEATWINIVKDTLRSTS